MSTTHEQLGAKHEELLRAYDDATTPEAADALLTQIAFVECAYLATRPEPEPNECICDLFDDGLVCDLCKATSGTCACHGAAK